MYLIHPNLPLLNPSNCATGVMTDGAILMSRACELLIMEMTIKAVLVCQVSN